MSTIFFFFIVEGYVITLYILKGSKTQKKFRIPALDNQSDEQFDGLIVK